MTCDAHYRTWPSYSSKKSYVKIWFGLVEPFKSYRAHKLTKKKKKNYRRSSKQYPSEYSFREEKNHKHSSKQYPSENSFRVDKKMRKIYKMRALISQIIFMRFSAFHIEKKYGVLL